MLTWIDAASEEVAVPDDGEAESHCDPPEVVDVVTEKFDASPPASTVSDWVGGLAPPATALKYRPFCESCNSGCGLLTVAITGTSTFWGPTETWIVPTYVPSAKPLGLKIAETGSLEKAFKTKLDNDSNNQGFPSAVMLPANNDASVPEEFWMTIDLEMLDFVPASAEKLKDVGDTESGGAGFPDTDTPPKKPIGNVELPLLEEIV